MNILMQNARDARSKGFSHSDKEYIAHINVNFFVIMETIVGSVKAEKSIAPIGWNTAVRIDPISFFFWDIWVIQKEGELNIEVISSSNPMVNVLVTDRVKGDWLLTALYASPINNFRQRLWEAFKKISAFNTLLWLFAGDFNEISNLRKKKHGMEINIPSNKGINSLLEDCYLIHLGTIAPKYTWSNGRFGNGLIKEGLDKAFCNVDWGSALPNAIAQNLPKSISNHHRILILIEVGAKPVSNLKLFKVEMAWFLHENFDDFLTAEFKNSIDNI